jgi:hypothetical protein
LPEISAFIQDVRAVTLLFPAAGIKVSLVTRVIRAIRDVRIIGARLQLGAHTGSMLTRSMGNADA